MATKTTADRQHNARPAVTGMAGCVQQFVGRARAFVYDLTTREPIVWLRYARAVHAR
jgi:hypothetical protein